MDALSSSGVKSSALPTGFDHMALVLQGGGALGAYQAGVYQALDEARLYPDSVAGVSIGGINSAIIAGNRPERRVERLREFWEKVTSAGLLPPTPFGPPEGDLARKIFNMWSSMSTIAFGQNGFFTPRPENAWFSPRGAKAATSFYDTAPLRETLLRLVDFDLLNKGDVRYAAGAVHVTSGNFIYFDSTKTVIRPEHVMASGALPPALPMVQIGTDHFWDGGLVSNTPLQHIIDNPIGKDMLVFQVDLFSALGALPRDMPEVLSRQKDIQYSSRTRLVTDYFRRMQDKDLMLKGLLDRLPDEQLSPSEKEEKARLADMPGFTILHLIYQQAAYEGDAKDYEFSAASMREHWNSGYEDTKRTLSHKDWMKGTIPKGGIEVHDVHREDDAGD